MISASMDPMTIFDCIDILGQLHHLSHPLKASSPTTEWRLCTKDINHKSMAMTVLTFFDLIRIHPTTS
jgi:hypothetical protein